jgi:hypothetical protein
MVWEKVWG